MNRTYRMSRKEYEGMLQMASEQVPFGIYAVEKDRYAELRNDKCRSITQLKAQIRQFKAKGFKVYANRGEILKDAGEESAKGALMSAT